MNGAISERFGSRSGQAFVELLAALVVVMVLIAGLLTISELGMKHTASMVNARRDAGVAAMRTDPPSYGDGAAETPVYIAAVTVGDDEVAYTRDDDHTPASVPDFQGRIVQYSHPTNLAAQIPNNTFTTMSSGQNQDEPYLMFGLVGGWAPPTTVSLTGMPVFQELLSPSESVDIQGKAWLTWTTGIY